MTDTRPLIFRKRYPRRQHEQHPKTATIRLDPTNAVPYAAKALSEEVDTLARTAQGRRNDQLNIAAFNLAQLVAAGYLDRDKVWDTLHHTAVMIGLSTTETTNTLRSAFTAGTQQPRVVADLDAPPEPTVLRVNGHDVDADQDEDPEPPSLREQFPALDWHALWADDTKEEWIVEPLLPARRLVALFSPPKVGKSLLMLELAVAIARGVSVLGTPLDRPRRVLYVDFENDPRGDIRTRLVAMGVEPGDLDNLVYLSYPQLAFLDTAMGGLQLLAIAQEYGCEVVVIDTISRAVTGEENDNDTWLGFYRNTGVRLKSAGIATIRLDHTGKDATKGMRGGSAKYGDVDAVWSMTRITEGTFRLECTANRLPIAEKSLVIERRQDPLHHVVTTKSTGDVYRDEELALVTALDNLGVPNTAGKPACLSALKLAGYPTPNDRRLRGAVKTRKDRLPHLSLVDDEEEDQ